MPKKMFSLEPPVIFNELLAETHAAQSESESKFVVNTPDPMPESFAVDLITQYYPPQGELQLD